MTIKEYEVLIEIEASSKEIDEITCFFQYSFSSEERKNLFVYFITDFCERLKNHYIIDDFALLEKQNAKGEKNDKKRS